jgi:hypothetical protein
MSNPPQQKAGKRKRTEHPTHRIVTFSVERETATANIDDDDLIGRVPTAESDPGLYKTLQIISNFLTHHRLVVAASSATKTTGGGVFDTPVTAAPYYLPTLEEFAQAQLERQAAGLVTNANRETALGVTQSVEAHTQALNAAWNSDTTIILTNEKNGPPDEIDQETNHHLFKNLIETYRKKWWLEPNENSDDISRVYHAVALAAIVLKGFDEGNGEIAQVYINYTLKDVLKLPITITLAATPEQKLECIDGLMHGHRSVRRLFAALKNPPKSTPASSTTRTAALEPLIRMLVERVATAMAQVQSLLTERARAAVEEEEARVARRVRERAAAGQCIVCLDARPNIATLCCGQAVHLNCIAEWLTNGTTCVGCRSPLPRMNHHFSRTTQPEPPPAAAGAPNNRNRPNPMQELHRVIQAEFEIQMEHLLDHQRNE